MTTTAGGRLFLFLPPGSLFLLRSSHDRSAHAFRHSCRARIDRVAYSSYAGPVLLDAESRARGPAVLQMREPAKGRRVQGARSNLCRSLGVRSRGARRRGHAFVGQPRRRARARRVHPRHASPHRHAGECTQGEAGFCRRYGGQITFCEPTHAAREAAAARIRPRPARCWSIPSITGRHDRPGHLRARAAGGFSRSRPHPRARRRRRVCLRHRVAAKALRTGIRVLGAEPAGADDAFRSLQTRVRQPQVHPQTIADGLRTGLGENILRADAPARRLVTVSEDAIIAAMRHAWEVMKSSSSRPPPCRSPRFWRKTRCFRKARRDHPDRAEMSTSTDFRGSIDLMSTAFIRAIPETGGPGCHPRGGILRDATRLLGVAASRGLCHSASRHGRDPPRQGGGGCQGEPHSLPRGRAGHHGILRAHAAPWALSMRATPFPRNPGDRLEFSVVDLDGNLVTFAEAPAPAASRVFDTYECH